MPKKTGKAHIGTSGWIYDDWIGRFYPKDLNPKERLGFYSKFFQTVEINYSFYHLPRPTTYQSWYSQTPDGFIFAVKASRFITHTCLPARQVKRLKNVEEAWKTFIENALNLKEKLGPILFQFPPNFQATAENVNRLEKFLGYISRPIMRLAFEFRHQAWCAPKVYGILKKYNAAWVIADSPRYPKAEAVTADFVYIRMHGSKILFASSYSDKELRNLAEKIRGWLKRGLDVYIYFNNDFMAYAVKNAKTLQKLLS